VEPLPAAPPLPRASEPRSPRRAREPRARSLPPCAAMITPQHAVALRAYKYAGADRSILYHYVLSPWAQFLVDVATPRWLAPNAITFLGLLPPVLTLAVALQAQPGLGQGMAGWVALLCAASMFAYSTLDNMDGKQARKTGSSSALGLLFDHGAQLRRPCARAALSPSLALTRTLTRAPALAPARRTPRAQAATPSTRGW
jgi:hypothetical protein